MSLTEKLREAEKQRETKIGNSWRPEPNEILEGIVEKIGDTITEFGEQSFIEIGTGVYKYTVWCNSILMNLIDELEISKGDHIAIKFLGLKKSRKGNRSYKDYIVVKE